MILPITNRYSSIKFSAGENDDNKLPYTHDTVLKNTFSNRMRIGFDKFTNAMTLYPTKGLKGSKNANFYEFLTMGMVPYLVGSGMLMAVFNAVNKKFEHSAQKTAVPLGKKMALGVLFYGIMKEVSKSFVTRPVNWITGVDTELPYAKVIYELPDNINDTDITSIEYHKVFESVEFPRWDLLYCDETKGQKRNKYYDRVSRKLGMGKNLKDSDQEVKPRIKEIVVKTNLAKNVSSYLWAAVGVGLAFQEPWDKLFNVKGFKKSTSQFFESLGDSVINFFKGEGKQFFGKHSGKVLFGAAALSSILGVVNVVASSHRPSKLDSADIIEKDRKYVVN